MLVNKKWNSFHLLHRGSNFGLTYLRYGGHHLQASQLHWRRKWFTARHRIARTKSGHIGTADDQIANGQKDNRTLWITKTRRVYQEGEHLSS